MRLIKVDWRSGVQSTSLSKETFLAEWLPSSGHDADPVTKGLR